MDDNHWLIEWLAYHYYVLPLEDLVVAVDPLSRTSPKEIFNRWKGRINISEWNVTELDQRAALHNNITKVSKGSLRDVYIRRQIWFYQECLHHFKEKQRGWVMLTDSFIVVLCFVRNDHIRFR